MKEETRATKSCVLETEGQGQLTAGPTKQNRKLTEQEVRSALIAPWHLPHTQEFVVPIFVGKGGALKELAGSLLRTLPS